ncbi:hypothetical protein Tco_0698589 [Tanacetum coccineum]
MSNMSEDIQYAGFDTRPLMLDRTDFESWQQRIRLYCLGKDNGENIMKSITEGPFLNGNVHTNSSEDAKKLRCTSTRSSIPKDIYTLINHYTDAKDIWDNVKMILEGSELTKDDRESQLYDEFERFHQIKGETIHVYYVRFSKLINDMRNIKMTMSRMQLNSKFVNNMLPEWSRFITEVKLNRGLKESNFDQLNNATVQDGRVVVQDVRGRYNANNQGRPFQRNNAREVVGTGNVRGQNRVGNMNPGQAKPINVINCKESVAQSTRNVPQPKRP